MIQNSFPPALHHARLAGSSTSRLRPALLRSVETSSPVSAPRHSKPCRAIPASVAAMKCRIPFKASVAGGKVAGLGVVEAHRRQETSWPNQALQPTRIPWLRHSMRAAELGRWLRHEVAARAVSMQGSGVIPPVPPGGPTGLNQERPGQGAEAMYSRGQGREAAALLVAEAG